jgi:hypothetical protein
VAKIVVVPIVLIWNYLGRRLLVFHDRPPLPIAERLSRLRHMRRRDPEIDWVRDRQRAASAHTGRQPVGP